MTGGHPMSTIDIACRHCRTNYQIVAPVAAVTAWQEGEYIQDALDVQLELCKKIKNPFYC